MYLIKIFDGDNNYLHLCKDLDAVKLCFLTIQDDIKVVIDERLSVEKHNELWKNINDDIAKATSFNEVLDVFQFYIYDGVYDLGFIISFYDIEFSKTLHII